MKLQETLTSEQEKLSRIQTQVEKVSTEQAKIERLLAEAEKTASDEDIQCVIDERKPDPSLRKKVATLQEKRETIAQKMVILTAALQHQEGVVETLEGEIKASAFGEFMKELEPARKRLNAAIAELKHATGAIEALRVKHGIQYVYDHHLFPQAGDRDVANNWTIRQLKTVLYRDANMLAATEKQWGVN